MEGRCSPKSESEMLPPIALDKDRERELNAEGQSRRVVQPAPMNRSFLMRAEFLPPRLDRKATHGEDLYTPTVRAR
jgi:hypothetical protein